MLRWTKTVLIWQWTSNLIVDKCRVNVSLLHLCQHFLSLVPICWCKWVLKSLACFWQKRSKEWKTSHFHFLSHGGLISLLIEWQRRLGPEEKLATSTFQFWKDPKGRVTWTPLRMVPSVIWGQPSVTNRTRTFTFHNLKYCKLNLLWFYWI